jgi:hypothetical protein
VMASTDQGRATAPYSAAAGKKSVLATARKRLRGPALQSSPPGRPAAWFIASIAMIECA